MAADLHEWGLRELIKKMPIQDRYAVWIDRTNKKRIERQMFEAVTLAPYRDKNYKFSFDTNQLYHKND